MYIYILHIVAVWPMVETWTVYQFILQLLKGNGHDGLLSEPRYCCGPGPVQVTQDLYHTEANTDDTSCKGRLVCLTWRFDYTTEFQDLSMFFGFSKHQAIHEFHNSSEDLSYFWPLGPIPNGHDQNKLGRRVLPVLWGSRELQIIDSRWSFHIPVMYIIWLYLIHH